MTAVFQDSAGYDTAGGQASPEDLLTVAALCRGDEQAFALLLERYHGSMLRLAQLYVPSRAVAEEVVQEAWLGVLQGLARFEGRASLKTWIFRILTNRARTCGQREGRSVPFSGLASEAADPGEPTVDPGQFWPADHPQWANIWVSYPRSWEGRPEDQALARELRAEIQQAIGALPPVQREVITLRDVEGWPAEEICSMLGISEANQRVLLHRARAKVRRELDRYLNRE
jgi:RNA polymerase sigma-70 factor (ECF subfamily)